MKGPFESLDPFPAQVKYTLREKYLSVMVKGFQIQESVRKHEIGKKVFWTDKGLNSPFVVTVSREPLLYLCVLLSLIKYVAKITISVAQHFHSIVLSFPSNWSMN